MTCWICQKTTSNVHSIAIVDSARDYLEMLFWLNLTLVAMTNGRTNLNYGVSPDSDDSTIVKNSLVIVKEVCTKGCLSTNLMITTDWCVCN